MAKNKLKLLLSGKFDFDPEEILDKSLLFDLKKTNEEKIFDSIFDIWFDSITLSIGKEWMHCDNKKRLKTNWKRWT